MPRNVRPSWVELDVSSRPNIVATGPKSKDGHMRAQFYIRKENAVARSVAIHCSSPEDGRYLIKVYDETGNLIHEHATED